MDVQFFETVADHLAWAAFCANGHPASVQRADGQPPAPLSGLAPPEDLSYLDHVHLHKRYADLLNGLALSSRCWPSGGRHHPGDAGLALAIHTANRDAPVGKRSSLAPGGRWAPHRVVVRIWGRPAFSAYAADAVPGSRRAVALRGGGCAGLGRSAISAYAADAVLGMRWAGAGLARSARMRGDLPIAHHPDALATGCPVARGSVECGRHREA